MNVPNKQWITKTALFSFLVVVALVMGMLPSMRQTAVTAAPAGYYTDQDNEDNAGSGNPDGDMGGLDAPVLGATDPIHPIEFNIYVDEDPSGSTWYFGTRVYDIDSDGTTSGENDPVYLNGTYLGELTGSNGTWEVNNFLVPAGVVVQGNNLVRIEVDPDGWVASVQFGVLRNTPLGQVYNLGVTPAGDGSGTVTSSPTGIDCGADCFEVYDENTVVTLIAEADADSVFVGWSGDSDCTDGVVTLSTDTSCTANFDDVMPTTTTLTSSPNPSIYGQPLLFTATVAADTTPNEGNVTFQIGGVDIPGCIDVPAINGVATCDPGVLDVGMYAVSALYSGSTYYLPSSDALDSDQTIEQADTSVGIVSSANPSMYGSLVTFTATVTTDLPGMGVPVGTVSFYDGGTLLQTIPLDEYGQAAFTTVYPLAVGVHKIHTVYSGSENFNGSNSPIFYQHVEWATDLSIEKSVISRRPSHLTFSIVVRNLSCCCISAPGAIISDTLATYYSNATWACEASDGAECGALSGEGSLHDTLAAFPPGGIVTYTIETDYNLPDEGYIMNTAEIIPPPGVSDINASNNSAAIKRWFVLFPLIFSNSTP